MPITPGNPREIDQNTIDAARKMTGVIICGGEPMLNFSSQTMLENLKSDQNVRVHFNGTVMPRQSFMDQSARFEKIQYCFSIDGVGRRFEYLRWPAEWDQVVKNILWLVETAPDNVRFSVNITISQLNLHYQNEIVDWVNQTIPHNRNGKETVITYNQEGNVLRQNYLDNLDKKRNLNWRELFPLAIENIPRT
jgi:MoaA/NifB/PqqE/SkfB family radical SAM enzyme